MSEVQKCRECGGDNLLWTQCNSNKTDVAEGRLRTHEITCSFVLGCEDCSETIAVISADKFIANYGTAQSELAALREELGQVKRTAMTEILALNSTLNNQAKELAAAEQRNAELSELLGEVLSEVPHGWGESFTDSELAESIRQAIKPTESGASE